MADKATPTTQLVSNARTCTAGSQGTPGKSVDVGPHSTYLHKYRAPTRFETAAFLKKGHPKDTPQNKSGRLLRCSCPRTPWLVAQGLCGSGMLSAVFTLCLPLPHARPGLKLAVITA